MQVAFRRFPGGLFPRFVALLVLLVPFYNVKGILLGVSVSLPQLFLLAALLYFLFEHEPFRLKEWALIPLVLFSIGAISFFGASALFPLLFFLVSRSVFREKPSMVMLALLAFIGSSFLMFFLAEPESFRLFGIPALFLCFFEAFRRRSKWEFLPFFLSGFFLLWALWPNFINLFELDLLAFQEVPVLPFWTLLICGLWMSFKALLWLPERDPHGRFLMAGTYLLFLLLLPFHLPFLEESHLYLFWFFMAILL